VNPTLQRMEGFFAYLASKPRLPESWPTASSASVGPGPGGWTGEITDRGHRENPRRRTNHTVRRNRFRERMMKPSAARGFSTARFTVGDSFAAMGRAPTPAKWREKTALPTRLALRTQPQGRAVDMYKAFSSDRHIAEAGVGSARAKIPHSAPTPEFLTRRRGLPRGRGIIRIGALFSKPGTAMTHRGDGTMRYEGARRRAKPRPSRAAAPSGHGHLDSPSMPPVAGKLYNKKGNQDFRSRTFIV